MVPGALFPEIKRLGREDDHTLSCIVEVENGRKYISTHSLYLNGVSTENLLYL
jgi:hypothetical protein